MTRPVAVLFLFHRDLPVCRNRLEILRRDNPATSIFGLYGGDLRDIERFREALAPQLDDFWAFERPVSARWKWRHNDLMLAAWYEACGCRFEWDHIFVAQWDLLVLQPLSELLPPLADDEVLLSGTRPVAALEANWVWTRGGHEREYRSFLASMETQFGPVEPMSCLFILACLPRRLLAAYRELPDPNTGISEYRLPTLATAVGLCLVDDERFAAWRPDDTAAGAPTRRQRFLNGSRRPIRFPTVLAEIARPRGARLFHPYHGLFPINNRWAMKSPAWAVYITVRAARDAVSARTSGRRLRRR